MLNATVYHLTLKYLVKLYNVLVVYHRMKTMTNMQFLLMQISSAKHMLWCMMEAQVHLLMTAVSVKFYVIMF